MALAWRLLLLLSSYMSSAPIFLACSNARKRAPPRPAIAKFHRQRMAHLHRTKHADRAPTDQTRPEYPEAAASLPAAVVAWLVGNRCRKRCRLATALAAQDCSG